MFGSVNVESAVKYEILVRIIYLIKKNPTYTINKKCYRPVEETSESMILIVLGATSPLLKRR